MPTDLATPGLNSLDRARRLADLWAERNLYCPNCALFTLKRVHGRVGEFRCSDCQYEFQMKARPARFGKSIDAGKFDAVTRALRDGRRAGYFLLRYEAKSWTIRDLLLVSAFAIPASAIAKRAAGCHIVLDRIPSEGRIALVTTIKSASPGGTECIMISRPEGVREKFRRLKPRPPRKPSRSPKP